MKTTIQAVKQKESFRRYQQKDKLAAQAKAQALGEPRAVWPSYSRLRPRSYCFMTRNVIWKSLDKVPAPLKPSPIKEVGSDVDGRGLCPGTGLLTAEISTRGPESARMQYEEDLKEWEKKITSWRAQRELAAVELLLQEKLNGWYSKIRSRRGVRGCSRPPGRVIFYQKHDLHKSYGAKARVILPSKYVVTSTYIRRRSSSYKLSVLWTI